MSIGKKLDFWLVELPAYGLAATLAFMLGWQLLHWSAGLLAAALVVRFIAGMGPTFKRLLNTGEKSAGGQT